MALAVGGIMLLPACEPGLKKASVESYLTPDQDKLLAEVVDTLIPATDTAGAKELDVHLFVKKVVRDCYEKEVQELLAKGLDILEKTTRKEYGSSFLQAKSEQRLSMLEKMERSEEKDSKAFFSLVKELTIQGYTTSEYVLTRLTGYQMAPGHYYGCVAVDTPKAA